MKEKPELISIVSSVLNNTAYTAEIDDWQGLYKLAEAHGLLIYLARFVNGRGDTSAVSGDIRARLSDVTVNETARSVNQLFAVEQMQRAFETRGIYNLAVKGSVTKQLYPDELLRPMSDIDILYKPAQHKDFKAVMLALGYSGYQEGRKNDTYDKPPYIKVEAHREMVHSDSDYSEYYSNIWSIASKKRNMSYSMELTREDELVFNIVHLAEHFKEGGAGVRFIIDVYVFLRLDLDFEYVEAELKKLGLLEFYKNVCCLARYWFDGGECTGLCERLGGFVMSGGVFGDSDNWAALAVQRGRLKGFIRVCFPNYRSMKSMFPWLEGKPFLLPAAWIARGFRSVFRRPDHIKTHVNRMRNGDVKKGRELSEFYSECGL